MSIILSKVQSKTVKTQYRSTPELRAIAQLAAEQAANETQASQVELALQAAAEIQGDEEKLKGFTKSFRIACGERGVKLATVSVYVSTFRRLIKAAMTTLNKQQAKLHGFEWSDTEAGSLDMREQVSGSEIMEGMGVYEARKAALNILSAAGTASKRTGAPKKDNLVLPFPQLVERISRDVTALHTYYGADQRQTEKMLEVITGIENWRNKQKTKSGAPIAPVQQVVAEAA